MASPAQVQPLKIRKRKLKKKTKKKFKEKIMQGGTSPKAQPFSEHVRELRQRLIYIIATLFLGSVVGYVIHQSLFSLIRRPLHQQLYYTTPIGGFNAMIKISILFGLIVTAPVFVYQLGKFLSPAFRRRPILPMAL